MSILDHKYFSDELPRHFMAGSIVTIHTKVYRYDDKGEAILVADCLTKESADAASRLMAM